MSASCVHLEKGTPAECKTGRDTAAAPFFVPSQQALPSTLICENGRCKHILVQARFVFCFSEHLRCFFSPAHGNTCWHSWLPSWVVGTCQNGIGRVWLRPSAPAAAVAAPVIGKCINCLHWREEMVDIIVWHAGRLFVMSFHYVNA